MATRYSPPRGQVFSDTGTPLPGAKLYFYATGTSTPKATYSDAGLTVVNANPVVADSAGRFGDIFYGSGDYKVILKTSADVTVWTADAVPGAPEVRPDGWVPIQSQTAASVGAVDFDLPPGYAAYRVEIYNLYPSVTSAAVLLRGSSDGGSTFHDGASDYSYTSMFSTLPTTASVATATSSYIDLTGAVYATPESMLQINIQPGNTFGVFRAGATGWVLSDAPEWRTISVSGGRSVAGAVDAIRIFISTGTMAANFILSGLGE